MRENDSSNHFHCRHQCFLMRDILQTISILEQSKLIDTELLGLYAIMLGVLAAAGEGGLNLVGSCE